MYKTIEMVENQWVLIEIKRGRNLNDYERFLESIQNGDLNIMMQLITEEFVQTTDEEDQFRRFPLHYACEKGNEEIVKKVLEYNANVDAADSKGWRALHCACSFGMNNIVKLLMDNECYLEPQTNVGITPMHLVCSNNHKDTLELLLERGCSIEVKDYKRWRPIHYASYNGHKDIVKLLIDHGCKIEVKTERGWRPIHCASSNDQESILNLLILNYCQLNCETKDNETPLYLATLKKSESCLKLLEKSKKMKDVFQKIVAAIKRNDLKTFSNLLYISLAFQDYETKQTLLDIAIDYGSKDILNIIKMKRMEDKEVEEWLDLSPRRLQSHSYQLLQECYLYRSIRYQHCKGFELWCIPNIVNMDTIFMEASALEVAAEFGCNMFVEHVLKKIMLDNESWNRAILISERMKHSSISSIIRDRKKYLDTKKQLGNTRLHIAVLDNDPSMVRYIMDNHLIDPDTGDKGVGTALSLAYFLGHNVCQQVLQNYKVNSNTVDKLGRSPLHIAIENGAYDTCDYLIKNIKEIEGRDITMMSPLDLAVIRGCESLCNKLMERGSNFTKRIKGIHIILESDPTIQLLLPVTYNESSLTLCYKINGTLYECFLDALDYHTINECDGDLNSLLHMSAMLLKPIECRKLINREGAVNMKNKKGNTPLMEMLNRNTNRHFQKDELIETINILIEAESDINDENIEKETVLELASRYKDNDVLLAILKKKCELLNFSENLFLALYHNGYLQFLCKAIPRLTKHLQQKYISADIINHSIVETDINMTKILFHHAHYDEQEKVLEKMIYRAAIVEDTYFLDELLKRDIQSISLLDSGESILTAFILERKTHICQRIIDSTNGRKYINFKNKRGYLPLHLVIMTRFYDIIHDIITETDNINEKNGNEDTALALLFKQIENSNEDGEINFLKSYIKIIIFAQGDIYEETNDGITAISHCSNKVFRSKIEKFYHKMRNGNMEKSINNLSEHKQNLICTLCKDKQENCTTECGHQMCRECYFRLDHCPFCRAKPILIKK